MKKTAIRNGGAPRLRDDAARGRSIKQVSGAAMGKGKGTIAPRKLQCFSVACVDMPQLEFGDKIVLPSSVLLELQCFKVPTPMLFHIRSFGSQQDNNDATSSFAQYCSVQEFSAPDGKVFIPYWMMQNLHIGEGADVIITNVIDIPRGIYCRLQPEDAAFLDIAAEIGPKLLMESALRRYSVMSVDETILIDHGNQRFYVKVVELKPGSVVSLLGDVDLEMDFVAPARTDPRRPKSGLAEPEVGRTNQADHVIPELETPSSIAQDPGVSAPVGFGRRLGDGVCVADDKENAGEVATAGDGKATRVGVASFHAARQKMAASEAPHELITEMVAKRADTESLAKDVKLAQAAFSSAGHRLGGRHEQTAPLEENPAHEPTLPPTSGDVLTDSKQICIETNPSCPLCLSELSYGNMELHSMRCAKNPSYHKYKCQVCEAKVLGKDRAKHQHCPHCKQLFESEDEVAAHVDSAHSANHQCPDCGTKSFKLTELETHRKTGCSQAFDLCTLCGFKIKRKDMAGHTQACSSRTERCEVCEKYVKIVDLDDHIVVCVSDREAKASASSTATVSPRRTISNQQEDSNAPRPATLECIYCMKRSFLDKRQLDRHVNQECVVARSFKSPMASLPPDKPSVLDTAKPRDVRTLIQGKLKRQADAKKLSDSSSRLSLDTTALLQRTASNNQRDAAPDLLIKPRAHPQSHPSKSKPRTTHTPSIRPTQLESLPTKPAPPQSHDAGLFIGSSISSANFMPAQPRFHAQRNTTTRKLLSLPR